MNIGEISKKRFTTKKYDASKKIPEDQLKQLLTVLRYSPSSVNSQPWHFFVVNSDAGKQKILPGIAEFNHDRITNASHIVIFCAKTQMPEEHLQAILNQEDKDGRFANEEIKKANDGGRHFFVGLNNNSPEQLFNWESKQVYIALGNLMLAAATLGIDSTPIEGFDQQKLDEVLGLKEKGLSSVVVASLGYHAADDFNSKLPKSRFPEEQIFTFM